MNGQAKLIASAMYKNAYTDNVSNSALIGLELSDPACKYMAAKTSR